MFRQAGGRLAIIGGRLERDNDAVFEQMRQHAGARIAVLATASEAPEEVGSEVLQDFLSHGFEAELVPLVRSRRETAFDPAIVARIETLGSVFFTGGDQLRIVETLIQDGVETPVLQKIRALYADGGLVAGSSAGAAVMSAQMILGGASLEALVHGVVAGRQEPGLEMGAGLGFFPWGVVDQHFIKRGRIGRLMVALKASGASYGFGVDENTALFVEDGIAQVRGETGVVVVDSSKARFGVDGHDFSDVRISYLDDGDRYHLNRHKALPAPDKKRIRVTRTAYCTPAPFHRNAFGSYALHELLIRLAKGDPVHYQRDSASAFDPRTRTEVRLELERVPRRSRVLSARRGDEIRYSAFEFSLHASRRAASQRDRAWHAPQAVSVHPPAGAQLILLGSMPLNWGATATAELREYLLEPVGVIAAAAAKPGRVANDYIAWLEQQDIAAEDLDVTAWNIDSKSGERRLLKRIRNMRTLVLAGGDQRRLTETLLHRGEATPVLKAIVDAYQHGATVIGAGGAAAAAGSRMIAEGNSFEALRYGASEDAGYEGVVIEEGLGLFAAGIVDQNFVERRRLGRLLVVCAEEGVRYGFGLCEESGLLLAGHGHEVRAFGRRGFLVAAVDQDQVNVSDHAFGADDIRLLFIQPGEGFDLDSGAVLDARAPGAAAATLEQLVAELAQECNDALRFDDALNQGSWLQLALSQENPASLDVQSRRTRADG